ncbi:uncharacterized protein [Dermacentor andersoni]|uniref:uncharacterized protein n=1 Tax=Dermacentor andersoni TaxID=34620 RepID=UPI003B3B2218
MRRLSTLVSVYVLAAAAFADIQNTDGPLKQYREKLCNSPNTTNPKVEDALNMRGYYATMHYYNATIDDCEELPESIFSRGPENGVFYVRYDCVRTCAPGKNSSFCADPPYEPMSEGESGRKWNAWFYNISSEECQRYKARSNPWHFPKRVNGFGAKGFCENNCGKFNSKNVNGSETCEQIVSCTEQPPGFCEKDGDATRYFYNSSSGNCEQYQVCEDYWPRGASAVNYFVTQEHCKLSCSWLNQTRQTGSEMASM